MRTIVCKESPGEGYALNKGVTAMVKVQYMETEQEHRWDPFPSQDKSLTGALTLWNPDCQATFRVLGF